VQTLVVVPSGAQQSWLAPSDLTVVGVTGEAINLSANNVLISTDPSLDVNFVYNVPAVYERIICILSSDGYRPLGHSILKGESVYFSSASVGGQLNLFYEPAE